MRHLGSTVGRARRALMRLMLALPASAWAADFGFKPPRDPEDAAAADLMRDLAGRILPVYQDADTDVFLANLAALQIVSGAYRAASDSSRALRTRRQGKPFDDLVQRAILDGIYARARALEANERLGFAEAYARAFRELVSPLDNAQAQAIMARLEIPAAVYAEPLRRAFDLWRAKGSLPQDDALALVRTWHSYESRRSFGALLPELIAAENRNRYVAEADLRIPVRGAVIHARLVRPGRANDAPGALPTLLRFTLDPAEDDAQRSAAKGYVGVTAYVRGRTPDGKGAVWPFVRDGEDAAAVVDWIARQAWSDGRVCMSSMRAWFGPAAPMTHRAPFRRCCASRSIRPRTTPSAAPPRAMSASRRTCADARPTARAPCGRSFATAKTPPPSSTGLPGRRGATAASA